MLWENVYVINKTIMFVKNRICARDYALKMNNNDYLIQDKSKKNDLSRMREWLELRILNLKFPTLIKVKEISDLSHIFQNELQKWESHLIFFLFKLIDLVIRINGKFWIFH